MMLQTLTRIRPTKSGLPRGTKAFLKITDASNNAIACSYEDAAMAELQEGAHYFLQVFVSKTSARRLPKDPEINIVSFIESYDRSSFIIFQSPDQARARRRTGKKIIDKHGFIQIASVVVKPARSDERSNPRGTHTLTAILDGVIYRMKPIPLSFVHK